MEPRKRKVLKINIHLSEGKESAIFLKDFEEPKKKSEEFIRKHKLDPDFLNSLMKYIENAKREAFGSDSLLKSSSFSKISNKGVKKILTASQRLLKHSYRYSESTRLSSSINYGNVLYEKGMKMREKSRQNSKEKKDQLEKTDKLNLTFRPKISKKSQKILTKDKVLEIRERSQKKLNFLLKSKKERDNKDCYFTPEIMSKRTSPKRNIFNELYNDACRRNSAPDSPVSLLKDSLSKPSTKKIIQDMVERLSSSNIKKEENLETKRQEANALIDKETGQKFFHPLVLPQNSVIREERTVWEDLYASKSIKYLPEIEKNFSYSNESSSKYFENFKVSKFKKIFAKLDSDNDGVIDKRNICLAGFEDKFLALLGPILIEINNGKKMTVDEFSLKLNEEYSGLAAHDRMEILKNLEEEAEKKFSFKPVINERSRQIACHDYLGGNVYERAVAAKEIKQLRMNKKSQLEELAKNNKNMK